MSSYLFTSPRLGFRRWQTADLDAFTAINSDLEVMRFFERVRLTRRRVVLVTGSRRGRIYEGWLTG